LELKSRCVDVMVVLGGKGKKIILWNSVLLRNGFFFKKNVAVKEKVVFLRPQKSTISTNHLKEGSVLK